MGVEKIYISLNEKNLPPNSLLPFVTMKVSGSMDGLVTKFY